MGEIRARGLIFVKILANESRGNVRASAALGVNGFFLKIFKNFR